MRVLRITGIHELKITEVILSVPGASQRTAGLTLVTLIRITWQRRKMHPLLECRTGTKSNLIDNRVVRQCQRETTIVSHTARKGLIASDSAAVTG